MKTVVHTVPGTGSRFVCDILERVFHYKGVSLKEFLETKESNVFILVHAQPIPTPKLLDVPGDVPFVVALRHPFVSYFTRMHTHKERIDQYAARWYTLRMALNWRDPVYIPVDADLGRLYLIEQMRNKIRANNESVNIEARDGIVKHWHPVGSNGIGPEQHEFLMTGKVAGYDFTPLQDAMDWYHTQVENAQS